MVDYWKFYENIGYNVNDRSLNDNNGKFGGTPNWVTSDILF